MKHRALRVGTAVVCVAAVGFCWKANAGDKHEASGCFWSRAGVGSGVSSALELGHLECRQSDREEVLIMKLSA